MKTREEYIESFRVLHLNVYFMSKKIDNPVDHPMICPSLNSLVMTYELAQQEEYKDLMTAASNITGKTVNRFCHIHQSVEDPVKKAKMQRLLGQKTASCFQRCVGTDAFNAIWSTTYKADEACGTNYHQRFRNYVQYCQDNDLVVDGAMADPKGDRSPSPSQQEDPDLYVYINEIRPDGIVVTGAKTHQTGSVNSHEHLIVPTCSMREDDADYVVSSAIPSDAEGVTIVYGRQSCDTCKMGEGADIDLGNSTFGGHETLFIMDHVFVPMERVSICREYQFSNMLVERFVDYHRQSYGGCKVGVGDILIDAVVLAADYNGVPKASHIKDKLTEMVHLNETLYACGIACSAEGKKTKSGNCLIDMLLANVCKQNVTRYPYEITRLAEDIAGGLVVTMPNQADLQHKEVSPLVRRYLADVKGTNTVDRTRTLRLIENLTLGTAAVGYRMESLHGAGSPQTQRIMVSRQCNMEAKGELARQVAHIDTSLDKKSQGKWSQLIMTDLSSRIDEITTIISSYVCSQPPVHGGDIALLRVADEQVFVKVSGSCQACPSLSSTIQKVVQETLYSELALPTLTVTVDDSVGDELIAEALRIIRK